MAEKNSSAVQGTVIQTATAPTFTNFAKLALEMQMKIWKHAIPAPRLVRVHVRKGDNDEIRFTTNASVPALLSACHTSRKIILEVYSTCLESGERKIRIDGENDVLVLFRLGGCSGLPDFLPWTQSMKMREDIQCMFSGAIKLAMVVYTFFVTEEQQRWFLSRFQSLKRYFPIIYCLDTDLDANGDGIYLAIQKHHLAILEQECVTEGVVYETGLDCLESWAESALRIAKVDRKFEVVPALIGENGRKHWWA
ncbi:hypothetical protein NA56DRAFT_721717 [Hyaloscypha hepaticicola]|uniref:2EXR domain-containing protein n=1 Tax=Hyaloscypha hepaticicola TaxID=2082293 RepID=A0A2J6QNP3_9HELO|nr:hypothetical protein NA56DRAFT_721717 [Hyaloscypha hepaticicola]